MTTDAIARAIDRLADATQAEADATRALVAIREEEKAQAAAAVVSRNDSDKAARATLEEFSAKIGVVAPALEMLTAIAETMRGKR